MFVRIRTLDWYWNSRSGTSARNLNFADNHANGPITRTAVPHKRILVETNVRTRDVSSKEQAQGTVSTCLTGNIEPRGDTGARANTRHALRLLFTRGERERERERECDKRCIKPFSIFCSLQHRRARSHTNTRFHLSSRLTFSPLFSSTLLTKVTHRLFLRLVVVLFTLVYGVYSLFKKRPVECTRSRGPRQLEIGALASRNRHVELGEFTSEGVGGTLQDT